jgi:hypothetical protein
MDTSFLLSLQKRNAACVRLSLLSLAAGAAGGESGVGVASAGAPLRRRPHTFCFVGGRSAGSGTGIWNFKTANKHPSTSIQASVRS